jgi:hypothetical protein
MFQVKEISKTNANDGINLVLPISINGDIFFSAERGREHYLHKDMSLSPDLAIFATNF